MRFMMMVKSGAKAEAGILPDETLLAAMGQYNDALIKAGAMLTGEGLHPTSRGTRVRLAGKKLTVTDGPFTEGKELIGGFWLIQAPSRQEAIEWARRVPGQDGGIEIRPLYELSDFPADPTEQPDGWREQEQRFREATDAAAPASAQPVRKPQTTRFMVMLRASKKTESGDLPDQKTLAAMGALMDEMARNGTLLAGEGLKPSATGARVTFSGDKRTVTDGPFAEAKELIAGYCIIQVKTGAEAVEFARRWLQVHTDGLHVDDGEIDVRPLFELSDFPVDPAEKPEGWRQREQSFRDRTGQ